MRYDYHNLNIYKQMEAIKEQKKQQKKIEMVRNLKKKG